MTELAEAANSLTSHSTENMEYPVKLLDKQRPVTIYHVRQFYYQTYNFICQTYF
jgi:hypothetical protein